VGSRWQVRSPIDVADRLLLQLGTLEREELHVLVLNTRNVVIDQERVYQGNVSASVVRIGELFRRAVELHASAILICHNHPSGQVQPSINDLHLTTEAIRAGQLLDILVLDHLIVGGGTFASLRDYGVVFGNPGDHRAGEASGGPPWRNPWLGTYKSCLQKSIRRGEPAKAACGAERLLALPGGRTALARRLPVITAEDVGARWLPAVGQAIVAAEGSTAESGASLLIGTAASLSTLDKDRTCGYLASIVWGEGHLPLRTSRQALEEAIAAGLYREALAICFAALEKRQWRGGERVIEALLAALAQGPELTREIGRWALWRERLGGAVGECLAAAVIAAIDRPDGPIPELPPVEYEPLPASTRPDWVALDQHTAVGSRVIARQARMLGMPAASLGLLMFDEEGIRCAPRELPSRWRDEALAMDAVEGGWGTPQEGAKLWASIRDAIRTDIEQELDR
jgi:RadC-like JAB domain